MLAGVGHVRWLNTAGEKEAVRIDQDLALAALHPLVAIKAANAPFSVVLTDWLSKMTPVGSGF